MDISSGNVAFGRTCPGIVMQDLGHNLPESVAKIKKLQTSFSRREVTYQCPIGCEDLTIVRDFISSINGLEELSVINYEPDGSALWPAILQQAKTLHSLAIHTPPQGHSLVWTSITTKEVAKKLLYLTRIEVDISLDEAESYLSVAPSQQPPKSVVGELAQMHRLESILVNVNLQDAASTFANVHTWNAMGSISFPEPNKDSCKQLALVLFDKLKDGVPGVSSLKHLELRFPRRCWDDRCQFWTLAYSVHVRSDEAGVIKVEAEENWKEYLPAWPEYGGFLWDLMH